MIYKQLVVGYAMQNRSIYILSPLQECFGGRGTHRFAHRGSSEEEWLHDHHFLTRRSRDRTGEVRVQAEDRYGLDWSVANMM